MTLKKGNDLTFNLLMLLCVVVWACAFPLIQIALEELSFVNLTILRLFVVCLTFGILFLSRKNKFSKLQKKDVIPIFFLGFFGVIIYHLGLNYGEQFVSAGAASLIIATIPVFIVIAARFILQEHLPLLKVLGISFALLGVLVIILWGKQGAYLDIEYLVGALAIVIASVMGAAYTIAGKKLLQRYSALSLTIYAMLLGSLGLIPFVNTSLFMELRLLSLAGWGAVIFLGIFSTVIGYVIWYVGLEMRSASELSVYLYCIPVLSTIISYFLLGQAVTLFFIVGGVFVITGVFIVNKKEKKSDSMRSRTSST